MLMRATCLMILLTAALAGCATAPVGPELLVIDTATYARAFDAADESVRAAGMAPTLRDRRSGVIHTEPRIAGCMYEPWRQDNADLDQALENTISLQRRRARIEFTPAGFDPTTTDPGQELTGPDLLGLEGPRWDLTDYDGEIELRVWVYLERSYTFGVRRSEWARGVGEQMQIIDTETGQALSAGTIDPRDLALRRRFADRKDDLRDIQPSMWVPVSRDEAYERRLMEEIRRRLEGAG